MFSALFKGMVYLIPTVIKKKNKLLLPLPVKILSDRNTDISITTFPFYLNECIFTTNSNKKNLSYYPHSPLKH